MNHLYQAATMVVNSSNTLYDKMVEVSGTKVNSGYDPIGIFDFEYTSKLIVNNCELSQDWNTVDLKKLVEDCGSKVCSQEEVKSSK